MSTNNAIKASAYRNARAIKDIADCMVDAKYMITITGRVENDRTWDAMSEKLQTLVQICTSIGIDAIGIVGANARQGYHIHAIIGDIGRDWLTDVGGGKARCRGKIYHLHPSILSAIGGVGHHMVSRIGVHDVNHVADYIARHMRITRQRLVNEGILYARPVRHSCGMTRSNRQRYYHLGDCIRVYNNRGNKGAVVLPSAIADLVTGIIEVDKIEKYKHHRRDMVRIVADYVDIVLALCISGVHVMVRQMCGKWLTYTPVDAYRIPLDVLCIMNKKYIHSQSVTLSSICC